MFKNLSSLVNAELPIKLKFLGQEKALSEIQNNYEKQLQNPKIPENIKQAMSKFITDSNNPAINEADLKNQINSIDNKLLEAIRTGSAIGLENLSPQSFKSYLNSIISEAPVKADPTSFGGKSAIPLDKFSPSETIKSINVLTPPESPLSSTASPLNSTTSLDTTGPFTPITSP